MKTKTQSTKKADKSLLIERSVLKLGGYEFAKLRIHCKPRTRIIVFSRAMDGQVPAGEWTRRMEYADVTFPPHRWTEYERMWASWDMTHGVEYMALAIPGYGK